MKYLGFYFLNLSGVAEGKIGVNWVNVIAMVAFIGIGIVIGKLI